MDSTREAAELVRRWQELQSAQVAGDAGRLNSLHQLAEAQASRPGASEEWALLAREAGRHGERIEEQVVAQPTVGVGMEAEVAGFEPQEVAAPDAAREPAEEGAAEAPPGGRRRGLGQLIWVVLIVGYLLLQVIRSLGDGGGP